MKFSLQSTHLIVRSGCSASEFVANSRISSLSDMISSPRVDPIRCLAGPLGSGSAVVQRGAADFLASIGVGADFPRSGGADVAKV